MEAETLWIAISYPAWENIGQVETKRVPRGTQPCVPMASLIWPWPTGVLIGTRNGTFQNTHISYVAGGVEAGRSSVVIADFNGDAFLDAAAANNAEAANATNDVSILLNEGAGFAGDGVPLAAFTPDAAAVDLWNWDSPAAGAWSQTTPQRVATTIGAFSDRVSFPEGPRRDGSLDRPLVSILPSRPMATLPALAEELFTELSLSLGSFA